MQFLSTPSARRATRHRAPPARAGGNFYPRPPRGGRRRGSAPCSGARHFYPRPPRGGRPGVSVFLIPWLKFLSTPSARRATRGMRRGSPGLRNFYPRPPRGGRLCFNVLFCEQLQFLSTPSARRATWVLSMTPTSSRYFYPRPPRGGRHYGCALPEDLEKISIHALREEGDLSVILALAELKSNFYPRPPRGGRLISAMKSLPEVKFLSTPSARRATTFTYDDDNIPYNFYPRPPRGGRQQKQRQNLYFQTNYTTFCTNLEEP